MKRRFVAFAVLIGLLWGLASGFVMINGSDWSVGTNNNYCGVYWIHMDFYCEHAE